MQHALFTRAQAGGKAALDDGPEASATLKFTKGSAHKVGINSGAEECGAKTFQDLQIPQDLLRMIERMCFRNARVISPVNCATCSYGVC